MCLREVALPRFLRSVTSQVMVSPCLRKCQNTWKISRGPWPRTVASLRRLTVNLSWLLSSYRSKVSISPISGLQIFFEMWQPQMTLSKYLLSRSPKYLLSRSAMWNEQFYGSSKSTAHCFPTHLLSDYFLSSACPLLSTYFLAVSFYKCMRLTTSTHGTLQCLYRQNIISLQKLLG